MKIEVGSVIFLIDPKSRSIIPARVNEQVVTKKIEGETITHNVALPNEKVLQLEALNAVHFSSIAEVREYLMSQAEGLIDISISEAQNVAAEKFGVGVASLDTPLEIPSSIDNNSNQVEITLPDGTVTKANVKIPSEFLDENTGH